MLASVLSQLQEHQFSTLRPLGFLASPNYMSKFVSFESADGDSALSFSATCAHVGMILWGGGHLIAWMKASGLVVEIWVGDLGPGVRVRVLVLCKENMGGCHEIFEVHMLRNQMFQFIIAALQSQNTFLCFRQLQNGGCCRRMLSRASPRVNELVTSRNGIHADVPCKTFQDLAYLQIASEEILHHACPGHH